MRRVCAGMCRAAWCMRRSVAGRCAITLAPRERFCKLGWTAPVGRARLRCNMGVVRMSTMVSQGTSVDRAAAAPATATRPGIAVLQDELRMLRSELTQLKACQLQYFTLSVTGTAALFGLAATRNDSTFLGLAFLAPLAIILPCWWIFFDKATTITRIVGYYRVIERFLREYPGRSECYVGYETALALYRMVDDRPRQEVKRSCAVQDWCEVTEVADCVKARPPSGRSKKIRHRYWQLNWYTYLALSVAACVLSVVALYQSGPLSWYMLFPIAGIAVVARFAWVTRGLNKQVVRGDYSYNENHCLWQLIHFSAGQAVTPAAGAALANKPPVASGRQTEGM